MKKSVRIISRFDKSCGIGRQGWSFLKALEPLEELDIHAVLTDVTIMKKTINELKAKKAQVYFYNEAIGKTDFSIFCDVMNQFPAGLPFKKDLSHINIASCVFDSTRVPSHWIESVHNDFDLVVTPSTFNTQAFLASGLKKDILTLPLIVEPVPEKIKKVKSVDQPNDQPLIFGFVGSFEKRKNVPMLLEAFTEAFSDENEAILYCHLTYSHEPLSALRQLMTRFALSNVHITFGKINEQELWNLYHQFDCYISLSMGEGYSFTPREFMSLGKPVIVCDTAAHSELPPLEGLYFIPATIPYPAFYPQIDNAFHGYCLGPYKPDVIRALKQLTPILKKPKIFTDLQAYVKTLSTIELRPLYQTLFIPKKVLRSYKPSIGTDFTLKLSSEDLIKKYNIDDSQDQHKKIIKHIVLANDAGFFSMFNCFMSILTWECTANPQAIVVPDWRIQAIIDRCGKVKDQFASFCYGRPEDGNIFFKLFEPLDFPHIDPQLYNNSEWLREEAIIRTDYNEQYEPDLTYVHAYKLYHRKDFKEWRQWYHGYFKKHIRLKQELHEFIQSFKQNYFSGYYVIASHIRHPSHAIEQLAGTIPPLALFKKMIDREITKAQKEQSLPVKIFIATDQTSVIDFFKEAYSTDMIYITATRTSLKQDKLFHSLSSDQQQKEGFQIQHIIAADQSKWGLKMAEEVIIDAWLLASANKLVHITSNISTAVSYINPDIEMIYCEEV